MTQPDFDEFARSELPALLRFAAVLTGSPDTASDVIQEVMVRAHSKWRRIGAIERPEAYVRRMVTNEWISHHRKWATRTIVAAPIDQLERRAQPASDGSDERADRADLWERLGRLPEKQRVVLVLRHYEGLTFAQIADVLRCREGTARSLHSRGAAALRIDLESDPEAGYARPAPAPEGRLT